MTNQLTENRLRILLSVLVGIALFLTYRPFIGVSFTDHDSMYTAIRWQHDDFHAWAEELARKQGRFTHRWIAYVQVLPFLLHSDVYYDFIKTSLHLSTLLAFYWTLKTVLDSRGLALLAAAFHLSVLCHPGNHSLLTGYLGYFQISLVFLCLSLLCLDRYERGGRLRWLIGSVALFCATLGGEDSPLYLVFHALIVLCRGLERGENRPIRGLFLRMIPFLAAASLFAVAVVAYRMQNPSGYVGNVVDWAELSPFGILKTLSIYTVHALPGVLLFADREYLESMRSEIMGGDSQAGPIQILLASMRWDSILKAATLFIITVWVGPRAALSDWRRSIFLGIAGLTLMVLPNAALSISPHYQELALEGRRVLTHRTYIVCFGVSLTMLALFMVAATAARRRIGDVGVRGVCLLGGVFAACSSLAVDCTNHHVVHLQKAAGMRWEALERFFVSEEFQSTAEIDAIHAPTLWRHPELIYYDLGNFSGAHLVSLKPGEPNYWEKLCYVVSGRRVRIVRDPIQVYEEVEPEGVYNLLYDDSAVDPDSALTFEPVTEVDLFANRLVEPDGLEYWDGVKHVDVKPASIGSATGGVSTWRRVVLEPGQNLYHSVKWSIRPDAELEGSILAWSDDPCKLGISIERHGDTPVEMSPVEWFEIGAEPTRVSLRHRFASTHESVRLRIWAPKDSPARFYAREAILRLSQTENDAGDN